MVSGANWRVQKRPRTKCTIYTHGNRKRCGFHWNCWLRTIVVDKTLNDLSHSDWRIGVCQTGIHTLFDLIANPSHRVGRFVLGVRDLPISVLAAPPRWTHVVCRTPRDILPRLKARASHPVFAGQVDPEG